MQFHESEGAVAGQGFYQVPGCLRKSRHLGPSATCLLPTGRVLTCEQRPDSQQRREDTVIISCPALSFLGGHSRETPDIRPPAGREMVLPCVSITLLVSWCPTEPEVRKSTTAWSILVNWLHSITKEAEPQKTSQPGHGMDRKLRIREGNRRKVFIFWPIFYRRKLQEMLRGLPWVK